MHGQSSRGDRKTCHCSESWNSRIEARHRRPGEGIATLCSNFAAEWIRMRATGILLLGVLLAQPTSPLGRTHRMAESVVASASVPCRAAAPRSGRVTKSDKETPPAPGPLPCGLRGLRGLRGGDSDAARTGGHECPGCGQAAVRRVVNKAGANKGRSFFCCARPSSAACRALFKWADAPGARAPSSAAALPRQVSPNITVVTRITAPTGQVTLRDSAGQLLAVSPHPRSLVPPPPSASASARRAAPFAS